MSLRVLFPPAPPLQSPDDTTDRNAVECSGGPCIIEPAGFTLLKGTSARRAMDVRLNGLQCGEWRIAVRRGATARLPRLPLTSCRSVHDGRPTPNAYKNPLGMESAIAWLDSRAVATHPNLDVLQRLACFLVMQAPARVVVLT